LLVHGFGSFRDELSGFAELAGRLADAGIATLRIDMSGCGASEPRGYVLPTSNWLADARAGLSRLEGLPGVDPDRLMVVGMSVGGGIAIQLAASDPRVKRAVALAPVAGGEWWLRDVWTANSGGSGWRDFEARVLADRARFVSTGETKMVERAAILPGEDGSAFAEYPQMQSRLALLSASDLLAFRPLASAASVTVPTRVIHSLSDESVRVDQGQALVEALAGERDLVLYENSPHCFWLGERADDALEATVDWAAGWAQ